METETYKNAKMILERFDPDSKKTIVSYFVLTSCNEPVSYCVGCLTSIFKHDLASLLSV